MSRGGRGQAQSRQQAVRPSAWGGGGEAGTDGGCPFRADKERWIRQKYVHKRFVHHGGADGESTPPPQPRPSPPTSAPAQDRDVGLRLYRAALAGDLVAMATALAQGAEVNRSVSGEEGRTALIGAAVGVRRDSGRGGGVLSAAAV